MSARRVLVVGSGRRARETALPAFERASDRFEVARVVARTAKRIEVEGRAVEVGRLEDLAPDEIASFDLVYAAVAKPAVPLVLASLARADLRSVDLLVDTPVLLVKQLGHLGRLRPFRAAWVAEDCARLPCFDPVRALVETGELGVLRSVEFLRSAWGYHGFAMAKAVLGPTPIASARLRKVAGERWREARLAGGGRVRVLEPRDYARGRMRFVGERAAVSDEPGDATLRLAALVEAGACVGFRGGGAEARLDDRERSLVGAPLCDEPGVSAWIEGMKRVGFLRLLADVDAGRGGYALEHGLDDSVADWHLERFGRYRRNPLTSPGFASARALYRALTSVARA